MPIPSPFHDRTSALCRSNQWKDWSGYHAVRYFDVCHEPEYFAFREAAGMIDVTPLFKYEVRGPDAARLLSRMMVKDIGKLKVGMVTYCCWTDDRGKLIDDGTVTRLTEDHYRVTAADPSYHWLMRLARRMDVSIEDVSESLAAVAVQGPNARELLKACTRDYGGDCDLDALKFFRVTTCSFDGVPKPIDAWITRTGYTGDLGYEVWCAAEHAHAMWDRIMEAGQPYGLLPCGLDALDMTRIEAGFVMAGVDYFNCQHVTVDALTSTPYEAGLGWCVNLERDPFVGQAALAREAAEGSVWQFRGLELDRPELERLYEARGLPPHLPAEACREARPVYSGSRQVGQITSSSWSPILKRYLALATLETDYAVEGAELEVEHTIEYERLRVPATVHAPMFFNPSRKRG